MFQSDSAVNNAGLPESLYKNKTTFEGYHSYQIPHSRVTLILDKESLSPVETASAGDEVCVAEM